MCTECSEDLSAHRFKKKKNPFHAFQLNLLCIHLSVFQQCAKSLVIPECTELTANVWCINNKSGVFRMYPTYYAHTNCNVHISGSRLTEQAFKIHIYFPS